MSIIERMKFSEEVLNLIDRKREETGDPNLGAAVEHELLAKHLAEIESEILENPGALEKFLIRRRP